MLFFNCERETSLWLAQLEFSPDLICIELMSHAVNDDIPLYIPWQT